jgi:hypothetical protein
MAKSLPGFLNYLLGLRPKRSSSSGLFCFCFVCFCFLSLGAFVCSLWCPPGLASASELRISRPVAVDMTDSCCQGEDGLNGLDKAIILPGSVVAHFAHWRKRYINPVFCPVLLCHGSCGSFDDACIMERGVLLLAPASGCAGSCK